MSVFFTIPFDIIMMGKSFESWIIVLSASFGGSYLHNYYTLQFNTFYTH